MACMPDYSEEDLRLIESATKQERADAIKDVLGIINQEFPLCICPEDRVNPDCPNELMDGAWTDNVNKALTKKITALASKTSNVVQSQQESTELKGFSASPSRGIPADITHKNGAKT